METKCLLIGGHYVKHNKRESGQLLKTIRKQKTKQDKKTAKATPEEFASDL